MVRSVDGKIDCSIVRSVGQSVGRIVYSLQHRSAVRSVLSVRSVSFFVIQYIGAIFDAFFSILLV